MNNDLASCVARALIAMVNVLFNGNIPVSKCDKSRSTVKWNILFVYKISCEIYPKNYAHSRRFVVICYGLLLSDFAYKTY